MTEILHDYLDRPVRVTEERLAHILQDPELTGMQDDIAETVRNPQLVIRSRSDAEATLSYRFFYEPS